MSEITTPTAVAGPGPTGAGDAVLAMTGIRKAYANGPEWLPVLTDVDLTVRQGDWVAIIGASGSGKSTLLNIVGLLDQSDGGTYVLNGTDVSRLDDRRRAAARNRDLGFVFQRANLLPRTSALENVATPLVYARCSRAEQRERAAHTLGQVGLGDRVDFDSSQLSGGQMQRVAIARALVTDPAVLLADEPTGNLDPTSGGDVLRLFDDLHASGRTIVMITHDLDVAARADRQLRLADGTLYPVDVTASPNALAPTPAEATTAGATGSLTAVRRRFGWSRRRD